MTHHSSIYGDSLPARQLKALQRSGRLSPTALALANTIMLAGAAHAQSTNQPPAGQSSTNAPSKLPAVVVTGEREPVSTYQPLRLSSPKYTEPLRDVPQTVTVIPRAVFEDQGATSLRDVLRNVPGISIQAGEGGVPAGDNLSIRGFNARTDMFIDGVRDFGGYSRDPFNLEQVEVVKGPASTYAGRGSTGGSINLSSKAPHLTRAFSATGGYGTDDFKRFTADFNQPLEKLLPGAAFRINGMFNDADFPGRDAVTNQRWGVAPSLAFGLGTPTRTTLSYSHLEQNNIPDYGIPWVPGPSTTAGVVTTYLAGLGDHINQPPPVDFKSFYGLRSRDYEKTGTDVLTANVEHDFNEKLSLRNVTRFGTTRRDSVITAPRFADVQAGANITYDGTINRQIQSRDQTDTMLANQTSLRLEFVTAKVEHTLVPGFDYTRETSKNLLRAGATSTTSVFAPGLNDPSPGAVTRNGGFAESAADTFGLYAFDTMKLGEKWQLSGGLRWDYFHLDYDSRSAALVPTETARTDSMVSWRSGLVYKPKPNGSIYFGYGTSFNPSAEGLTLGTGATAANNASTAPEQSQTFELGTKWDLFQNRLSLGVAVFRTEKTNARTEDPADPTDVITLAGVQRVDGVEFSLAGSVTEQWKVFGGYAYMKSEVASSRNAAEVGAQLMNTPEQSFTLWNTFDLTPKLQLGGGAQFTDQRANSTTTPRWAPGYLLYDAMVSYQVNQHVSLRFNIYNLTDENYIDRVGGGHFIPGAGRMAMLTASLKF